MRQVLEARHAADVQQVDMGQLLVSSSETVPVRAFLSGTSALQDQIHPQEIHVGAVEMAKKELDALVEVLATAQSAFLWPIFEQRCLH
jgi:hypothetical protein